MRHVSAIAVVMVLMGALMSGCILTSDTTQTRTGNIGGSVSTASTGRNLSGTSSFTTAVGSAKINGTFSGWLTAPMGLFNETQKLLEDTNATLYLFEVEIIGKDLNASITIPVLRLVPPFVPENLNITINGEPLRRVTYVANVEKMPVYIEVESGGKSLGTTSYLDVKPRRIEKGSGVWKAEELNLKNGSTIMRIDNLSLTVTVRGPGNYLFKVLYNGSEVSSGGLEVG
ncbi:hypothetical protein [Thermococcus sp.]|uniref:hypothetical protein n=1 Tax=Thermococcus sp. TaxID=35749 RepID=UPI002636B5FD|nr:hypothetical protein [Thermococcus sp.]